MSTQTEKEQEHLLNDVQVPAAVAKPLDKAFDRAWKLYYQNGGVKEISEKLVALQKPFRETMESGMLESAKAAWETSGKDHQKSMELFAAACAQLEFRAKAKYNKDRAEDAQTNNMQVILPGWTLAKTVVKKFFDEGRNLDETEQRKDADTGKMVDAPRFTSLGEMRKVVSARGARAVGSATEASVGISIGNVKISMIAKLEGTVRSMLLILAKMGEQAQEQAAIALNETNVTLEAIRQKQEDDAREKRHALTAEISAASGGKSVHETAAQPAPAKHAQMRAGSR